MHYSVNYVYSLLHSCYKFRRYYIALFRGLTPTFIYIQQ